MVFADGGHAPPLRRPGLHPCHGVQGAGFRVQGSGCRVQGSGFRVQGSGFRVQGAWFRVQGSGFSGMRPLLGALVRSLQHQTLYLIP